MRRIFFSLSVAICCSLTGTGFASDDSDNEVNSDHPLSDAAKSKPDEKFLGTWRPTRETADAWGMKDFRMDVGIARNVSAFNGDSNFSNKKSKKVVYNKVMRFTWMWKGGRVTRTDTFVFFATKIGKNCFVNIPLFTDDNTIKGYFLFKYEVSGDTLVFRLANFDGVIKGGKLKGRFDKNNWLFAGRVTDSTENIVRFLQQGGDKECFPDTFEFRFQRSKVKK